MQATADANFERLYQQAYYRHSGFGPNAGSADEAPAKKVSEAGRSFQARPSVPGLAFAGISLVMFVVPAVAALLVL